MQATSTSAALPPTAGDQPQSRDEDGASHDGPNQGQILSTNRDLKRFRQANQLRELPAQQGANKANRDGHEASTARESGKCLRNAPAKCGNYEQQQKFDKGNVLCLLFSK